jgi:hypothetical protein
VFGVPDTAAVSPAPSGSTKYLTENATPISTCSSLNGSSSGLVWYTGNTADCEILTDIGSLANPVVLVTDRKVKLGSGAQFFGILYIRDDFQVPGDPLLDAAGGGQVYGSVILEGSSTISGGPSIIFNKTTLQNIYNSPKFMRYGAVPGSWSDSVR